MAGTGEPFDKLGNFVHYENPGAESSTLSVWQLNAETQEPLYVTHFPPLMEELTVDVAIVGAGISGITTALLLQKAGYDVAVVDSHAVGYGVSGFNSEHITSMLLDMEFRSVISAFGEENTRKVTLALQDSIDFIERNVRDYRIECDFKRLPGYLFAERPDQLKALHEEFESAAKAGLPVSRTYSVPLPFPVEEGILVPDQARFNPLRYVQALTHEFVREGGRVFEHSRASGVKTDSDKKARFCVRTEGGALHADNVLVATHTPIGFRPALQSRLLPIRSYIIGVRTNNRIEDAVFWDLDDPYHYIRVAQDDRGPLLMIGGEDHKTGEKRDTEQCFRNLEEYTRRRFNVESVEYRWSAQLYDPADGLPYIGKLAGLYVITGLSGEGLTFGTLGVRMVADQICGIRHECADILSPARAKPIAAAGGFLEENVSAIAHFVKDRLSKGDDTCPDDIPMGEGRICNLDGQKVAVYHSPQGVKHVMSPVCTHMGCIVAWNASEKSWDCPCHGGRYDATGQVLNGPPVKDLKSIDLRMDADPESERE